jgi:hypothetical protein
MLASAERPGMERFIGARLYEHTPRPSVEGGVPFEVDVLQGGPYTLNKERMIELAATIQSEVFERDFDYAQRLVEDSFARARDANKGKASFMAARPTEGPDKGQYVAVAMHRIIALPVRERGGRDVNVLYSSRQIIDGYRRMGLGRSFSQHALLLHREADYLGYRGQNPASSVSFNRIPDLQPGLHFPFDKLYEDHSEAQELMWRLWLEVRRDGKEPDGKTGVTKGDLRSLNRAFTLDKTHKDTLNTYNYMLDTLHMNFDDGDAVIGLIRLPYR